LRAGLLSNLVTEPERVSRIRKVVAPARAERAAAAPIRDAAPSVRWDMLLQRMRALAARVLGLEASMLPDSNRPLQELGLDSLMAVELRNLMKTELGLERAPAATVVFDYPTVQALTDFVGSTSFGWGPRVEAAHAAASPSAKSLGISTNVSQEMDLLDDLERLSPEEAARLLRDRLSDGAPNT
jgi:acyl carrier protein